MKKLMMFMGVIAITLFSCSKDETCNCGTISNDGIDLTTNCYWLEIRNSCSGNKKKFCFDRDVWMNNHVGSDMCVNNEPKW